jgi:hypothetical protein
VMTVASLIQLYEEGGRKLSAEQVTKIAQQKLGSWTPSLRKVQEILKEHREHIKIIEDTPELSPLGEGWPKGPEEVLYLWQLSRSWECLVRLRWTRMLIDTALELRGVVQAEWDRRLKDSGSAHSGLPRQLLSPYGGETKVDSLFAIIAEITNRRILSQGLNTEIALDDLYDMLIGRPFAGDVSAKSCLKWGDRNTLSGAVLRGQYSRVMVDGVRRVAMLQMAKQCYK